MPVPERNSNKFLWETYETPCWSNNDFQQNEIDSKEDSPSNHNFTIRHLKQGGTGARKTWEASKILLNHLLCEGGPLRDDDDNNCSCGDQIYNIMELGGGAGCVAVGLATALNHEACQRQRSRSQTTRNGTDSSQSTGIFHPRARIMCTDNDKATIKNLRHNIARQPTDRNVSKTVRVTSLGWGENVGGVDFDRAVRDHFQKRRKGHSVPVETCVSSVNTPNPGIVDVNMIAKEEMDPLRLLTHVIASDVLYGVDALEPLSSVISAIKLRNPEIIVILAVRERSPNAVANLKARIEEKVLRGLSLQMEHSESNQQGRKFDENPLSHHFSVSVKNVTHAFEDTTMLFQMVEC